MEHGGELHVVRLVNQPVLGSAATAGSRDTHLDRPVLLTPSIGTRPSLAESLPRGQRWVGEGGKFCRGTWQSLKQHVMSHTGFVLKVGLLS